MLFYKDRNTFLIGLNRVNINVIHVNLFSCVQENASMNSCIIEEIEIARIPVEKWRITCTVDLPNNKKENNNVLATTLILIII